MTMPCSVRDRELQKFQETANGDTSVRVTVDTSGGPLEIAPSPLLPAGFSAINEYNEVNAIASASLTTIVSYTVTVGKTFALTAIDVDGDNRATYEVLIGGVVQAKNKTYYTKLNNNFIFDRLEIAAGTQILVRVEHNRPFVGDFRARIIGIEG